jgi:hypothetical protein
MVYFRSGIFLHEACTACDVFAASGSTKANPLKFTNQGIGKRSRKNLLETQHQKAIPRAYIVCRIVVMIQAISPF